MRISPEHLTWLQGAAGADAEMARRACQSAWRRWDGEGPAPLDASGKPLKKGDPLVLLPAPAGDDEARLRHPEYFATPAEAPAAEDAKVRKARKAAVRKARKAAKAAPAPPPPITRSPPKVPAVLEGIVPGPVRLCDGEDALAELIAEVADGRLARVRDDGTWLAFRPGSGWLTVTDSEMLKAAASVGRANLGSKSSDGEVTMNPRTGSRATTAAGVLRLLQGCDGVGTEASAWDSDPAMVGVAGDALDLRTGTMRPARASDRLRRRLAAAPADDHAYAASRWQGVVLHVIPDEQERQWLQRRLGLALMRDGDDDLIWIFGDSGSGKGVVLAALRAAFGSYAVMIPAAEVTAGAARGHAQWRARLRGCRLMLIDDAPPRDLDCGVINSLLGTLMTANAMRKKGDDFRVDAPLLVTANRLPRIRANDPGFRRRLKAIQAGASIPEDDRDPELRRAVTTGIEQAAVVRWLADGARMASGIEGGASKNKGGVPARIEGGGCPVPASIRARTGEVERDAPVSEFVELFTAGRTVTSDDLWRAWCQYQSSRGGLPGGRTTLTNTLRDEYGWKSAKGTKGIRQWVVGGAGGAGGAVSPSCPHDAGAHLGDKPVDVPLAPPAPPGDGGERETDDGVKF